MKTVFGWVSNKKNLAWLFIVIKNILDKITTNNVEAIPNPELKTIKNKIVIKDKSERIEVFLFFLNLNLLIIRNDKHPLDISQNLVGIRK